jgi:hypothetical protein
MIEFAQPAVATRSRVKGTVTWPAEGKQPQALIIMLAWRTEGQGTTDSQVVQKVRHQLSPPAPVNVPFDFEIPADGPVSYNGKLLRILWEIAVVIDIPWAMDKFEYASFQVVPHRGK